jgi:hypothetical protein
MIARLGAQRYRKNAPSASVRESGGSAHKEVCRHPLLGIVFDYPSVGLIADLYPHIIGNSDDVIIIVFVNAIRTTNFFEHRKMLTSKFQWHFNVVHRALP